MGHQTTRELPTNIRGLETMALDLRWSWSHKGDALWGYIDEELWARTLNPWTVLTHASDERLECLASDREFMERYRAFKAARADYITTPGWFCGLPESEEFGGVAYFSMEFGLNAALPIYAGGLGILAGDVLKSASDLNIPMIGIGLLYQEGYFRQLIDNQGMQLETYPYNEPSALPIAPVEVPGKGQLFVGFELPGRTVRLRVWKATIGHITLYLLDSNDPLNTPLDRGITAKLYGGGSELRLVQEIALGVGGWRVVEALHPKIEICHVNEGHAAFAIIERARQTAIKSNLSFWEALWATRAGNLFTTHTPVEAGFDRFAPELLHKYLPVVEVALRGHGVQIDDVLGLGRSNPSDQNEPFNMAFLAQRGCAMTMGVSRLHGAVSRQIFQPLFPRWPSSEVPIGYVTNGVHVPSWDSAGADRVWNKVYGKGCWRTPAGKSCKALQEDRVSDEELWAMRSNGRQGLVRYVRTYLSRKMRESGFSIEDIQRAETVLDPNVLTLGFARRFTEYKRPNLLLRDKTRLVTLLENASRPIQIVVAGKAHPADGFGKAMIQEWIAFARDHRFRDHVVFLEDYDISLAQEMVQGVDVWINTPRRPWEACGTSGMKVLVNGGLNCSTLDGWWDEAYTPGVGWSNGEGEGGSTQEIDNRDVSGLFDVLEQSILPEFYNRDENGLPRAWLRRIRESMGRLTPAFSGARMMEDYVKQAYLPLAKSFRARITDDYAQAKALRRWSHDLLLHWHVVHIGKTVVEHADGLQLISVPVYLEGIDPGSVKVELFADTMGGVAPHTVLLRQDHAIAEAVNGHIFVGEVSSQCQLDDYTARVVPKNSLAHLPAELPLIAWQK